MALLKKEGELVSSFNKEMAKRSLEKIYYDPVSSDGTLLEWLFTYNNGKVVYKGGLRIRDGLKDTLESIYIPGVDLVSAQSFDCNYCRSLKSLKGAPRHTVADFNCTGCYSLTSLEGAPEYVGMDFWCSYIRGIISLAGAPKVVGGNFFCSSTGISDLVGLPSYISGSVYCHNCNDLKTLKGAESVILGDICCAYCENLKTDNDFITVNKISL